MKIVADNFEALWLFRPELILLVSAILVMAIDFLLPRQRSRLPVFALLGAFFALLASFDLLGAFPTSLRKLFDLHANGKEIVATLFDGAVLIDTWTNVFRIIGILSASVAIVLGLSRRSFRFPGGDHREENRFGAPYGAEGEYSSLILLSTIGVTVMASSRDFLVTLIAFETMSLALYPTLTLARNRRSYEATTKYFLLGAAASALMLFGISFIFGETGTTRYADVGGAREGSQVLFGLALFISGLFFKIAAMPFHSWMPDVYETTPAPLGAFMAAGVKAAAFAALVRIVVDTLPAAPGLAFLLVPISALTMLVGNGGAMFQTSLTRLLGYSSVAHTGFLLMGISATAGRNTANGVSAVLIYLVSYTPAVCAAFALVALVERKAASDGEDDPHVSGERSIERLQGLYKERPVLAAAIAVVMASLAGLPPTLGFWGKFELFRAAFDARQTGLLAVALFTSIMGAYYYVRVVKAIYTAPPAGGERVVWTFHPLYAVVIILCSLALLIFGMMPEALIGLGQAAAGSFAAYV